METTLLSENIEFSDCILNFKSVKTRLKLTHAKMFFFSGSTIKIGFILFCNLDLCVYLAYQFRRVVQVGVVDVNKKRGSHLQDYHL